MLSLTNERKMITRTNREACFLRGDCRRNRATQNRNKGQAFDARSKVNACLFSSRSTFVSIVYNPSFPFPRIVSCRELLAYKQSVIAGLLAIMEDRFNIYIYFFVFERASRPFELFEFKGNLLWHGRLNFTKSVSSPRKSLYASSNLASSKQGSARVDSPFGKWFYRDSLSFLHSIPRFCPGKNCIEFV